MNETRPYSLCDDCVSAISWVGSETCSKCGKPIQENQRDDSLCHDCRKYGHSFEKGFTCATYEGHIKEIIRAFKFGNKTYYADHIASIMTDRMMSEKIDTDIVIPVPMTKKKLRKRGYNQADLVAKRFARNMHLDYDSHILDKVKETGVTSGLSVAERKLNLRGAFQVNELSADDVMDKSILLIDDVLTTGSTADACCESLLSAGAEKVYLLTFAAGADMFIPDDSRI